MTHMDSSADLEVQRQLHTLGVLRGRLLTMNLSDHFTLEELTWSGVAARHDLPNVPGAEATENLKRVAQTMEKVRALLGYHPIVIHSGYRGPEVNQLVGGVPTSAHCKGLACDFVCPGYGAPSGVALAIQRSDIAFDQLILEYGWVHLGLAAEGEKLRQECLTKRSATTPYEAGIQV